MTTATTTVANAETERASASLPIFTPPVDIYQSENAFVVIAEMPGVDESSVDITLEKGILTIQGESHREILEGYRLVRSEAPNGNYRRMFRLSEEVDLERADAVMKDGVLRLTLPKHENARPRKISVRSE
ncbi:MAG: Hsp20/alpha crystallin family protein [Candidatus Melainabacteria bacterium]|nr:Hsp20/alpha crystallin family protein [Candidatus Melainabacteria bacterium]